MKKGLLTNNFSKWMAGTALAAGLSVLPMKAQSQELMAFNAKAKTEEVKKTDKSLSAPLVREGGAALASGLSSIHNTIAVYIKGGEEGYSKAAADKLAPLFASRDITDHPLNVVLVYGEAGGDKTIGIYYDGTLQEAFGPENLTAEKLDQINDAFYEKYRPVLATASL